MENIFLQYIDQGRIRNLTDLKRSYRRIVMRTHPDAVGSNRLVDRYIRYSNLYTEARERLEEGQRSPKSAAASRRENYRLLFYKEFYTLERIDKPYAFNRYYNTREDIDRARQRTLEFFSNWKPDRVELYKQANVIYDRIKLEKPRGPYRRHALLFNLSPVFHNILSYQLSGIEFYRKQLKQNFNVIMHQLEERGFGRLVEYIEFLVADMEHGPVIFETD